MNSQLCWSTKTFLPWEPEQLKARHMLNPLFVFTR